MKRIHKLILSGALVLVVGIVAVAVNIPNTFVDGTPISASDMNQNFRVIQRDLNRNVVRIDPNNGYALVKGLYAKNPSNPSANFNFDWLNDVPRLRVGGTGVGSKTGLDIQTQGDRSLMRLHYDGTVEIKNLQVNDTGTVDGTIKFRDFENTEEHFSTITQSWEELKFTSIGGVMSFIVGSTQLLLSSGIDVQINSFPKVGKIMP